MSVRARFSPRASLFALVASLLATAAPHCTPAGALYLVVAGSAFTEGCIDGPCLCPVAFTEDVVGLFGLEELPTFAPGPNRLFRVNGLRVRVGRGEHARRLLGEGLYQNDSVAGTQRLELSLAVDGGEARAFDSGLVPVEAEFPEISVEVSEFGAGACFDTRLRIRAVPYDQLCRNNDDCAADAFCRTPTGRCGALGVCTPRGDACPLVVDPVCGCDGRTYGNECEAGLNGVSVAAEGICALD